MSTADLIHHVAAETGLTRAEARSAVATILEMISAALARGERVTLPGLGTFDTRSKKSGRARDFRTGETVPVPPGRRVHFKPGKRLRTL